LKRKKNKLLINYQYELVPLNNAKRKLVFLFEKFLILYIRESIYLLTLAT